MKKLLVQTAELILDAQTYLGEGAIWNHKTQELYWVDIERKNLFIFDPASHQNRKIQLEARIGTVVPSTSGKAIVALQNGVFSLDLETEELTLISNPETDDDMRFNDGKCDPAGRLWVGSTHMQEEEGKGTLYRIAGNGSVKAMETNLTISNGIIWSLDQQTMYFIDTPTHEVWAYPYNNETGEIGTPSLVITIPDSMGFPDGMTIDAEGMLWIAIWSGSIVGRWNPKTGELIQRIDVPVVNVTSCAFGGKDLDTLYITTAQKDMSEEKLEELPLSGGLFAVKPGVKGVPSSLFVD